MHGPCSRGDECHESTGDEHPGHLGQADPEVGAVLERLARDDHVEAAVGQLPPVERVGRHEVDIGPLGDVQSGERVAGPLEERTVGVLRLVGHGPHVEDRQHRVR